jgi:hypothetical protein
MASSPGTLTLIGCPNALNNSALSTAGGWRPAAVLGAAELGMAEPGRPEVSGAEVTSAPRHGWLRSTP